MSSLSTEKIIIAFKKLGTLLGRPEGKFKTLMESCSATNAWFTSAEVERAVASLHFMLNEKDLEKWFEGIKLSPVPKTIGLILAGNIPMVGFHDVLSVLATGHKALIKLSSSDDKLLPALLEELIAIEPLFAEKIIYAERLKDFDAVIATGSNNTSRYFDYYFGKVPNIIRRNRNSVAVLTGSEDPKDIQALGHDLFDYFGLGCRNVSKIYLPQDYEIKNFFEPLESFQPIINHFKYNNNYDYNKSIYLVNSAKHFDNGFLLMKEDALLSSPLAVVYYEFYRDLAEVEEKLRTEENNIQCVISQANLKLNTTILGFGQSQCPRLWDYADNVDTIAFLNKI
eukprot:gene16405-19519_t